ncbi:hypothetical protein [Lacisediminihabitans profunda]|uniref:Uncharacterized protein n=1 Tax=Lacisediminihabitans profunda TaxID=2594790 RepID=A0A5C8UPQ8_9MICO|nr:hypothetical protein [Lacisediminihabitans profunda]TXN29324.1 hypothetical protein FVP33_14185 [Lacisediminihabitans profunda]
MIFELHEPTRSNQDGRGIATLRVVSGGRLILNAAAKRMLADMDTKFVQLLWDPETKRIGLRESSQDDPAAFRVADAPSQGIITSKSFITENEIEPGNKMRLVRDGDMWVASTADTTGSAAQ